LIKTNGAGNSEWTQAYNWQSSDGAREIQQTADGGYIVAGGSSSFNRDFQQAMLLKTDINGDTLWMRLFADTSFFYSVQQTSDKGYVATGSWCPGYSPLLYLVKTDSAGDLLWSKWYGTGPGYDDGDKVRETPDGGLVILGRTSSFGAGSLDIWLLKTDANGDTVWTKTYGGLDYDLASGLDITSDDGYIIAGRTVSYGHGNQDGWLIRTDCNGDTLWTKCYGGSQDDHFRSVQQTTDSGFIAVGYTASFGYGDKDFYVVRTDAQGESLWTTTYGGTNHEKAGSVQIDHDGGYSIVGYSLTYNPYGEMDVWMVKTKTDSSYIHEKDLSNNDNDSEEIFQTVFTGSLWLPDGKRYRIFNVVGQAVTPKQMEPGIYFVVMEADNQPIIHKVVRIR
jgi:hypothetical protein